MVAELRPDISAAVSRLNKIWYADRNLPYLLEQFLLENETVDTLCVGSYERSRNDRWSGLLTLTNRRLFFLRHGPEGEALLVDFPFEDIESARWSRGILYGQITIVMRDGSEGSIKRVDHVDGEVITDRTRFVITEAANPTPTPTGERPLACLVCGGGHMVNVTDTEIVCHGCGVITCIRRCPKCAVVKAVLPNFNSTGIAVMNCESCGYEGPIERFTVARFADFDPAWMRAARLLYGADSAKRLSDPDRRLIFGTVLEIEGSPGYQPIGQLFMVVFDTDGIRAAVGDADAPLLLSYWDITRLDISGRGEFTTQSGGGWVGGGYGSTIGGAAKGIFEGVVMAAAMNWLTTTTNHHIESIFHIAWNSGSVTLLNEVFTPKRWENVLSPVFKRIEEAQRDRKSISQDKVCPYCAETIKAAAVKCRYCGSDLS